MCCEHRWLINSMNEKLNLQFVNALAKKGLGFDYRQDLIDWAFHALEDKLDSKSLRILAGLHENDGEAVDEYLRSTLTELSIDEPDHETCLRTYVACLARNSINGEITLRSGCRELYLISLALGETSSVFDVPVGHLDDGWDLAEKGYLEMVDIERQTLTAMQALATADSVKPPQQQLP